MSSSKFRKEDYYDRGDYYELKYEQGSKEWLNARPEITGSTVAYYTGLAKKPNIVQTDEERENNFAMGHFGEGLIKKWFVKKYNKKIKDMSLIIPKDDLDIGFSPDAVSADDEKDKFLMECKTTKRLYKPLKEKGEIYDSHYYQMQMGLHLLKLPVCYYLIYAYEEKKFYKYDVEYNKDAWTLMYDKVKAIRSNAIKP